MLSQTMVKYLSFQWLLWEWSTLPDQIIYLLDIANSLGRVGEQAAGVRSQGGHNFDSCVCLEIFKQPRHLV